MAFTSESSNRNIEVFLDDLKLIRKSPITFENEDLFVLSPSVQNVGKNFDINLNTINDVKKIKGNSFLIVRCFDELLVGDLKMFLSEMTIPEAKYTNKKTKKWTYNVIENDGNPFIRLKRAKGIEFPVLKLSRKELNDYVSKLNEVAGDFVEKKGDDEIISPNKKVDNLTGHIHKYITSKGFNYSLSNIKNLYLSIRSKPFVIISGISGTGKTKIVQLFAESIGATEKNGQFKLIPVRPDWSDGSELLGYPDLKNEFQKGPLTEMVEKAMDHPEFPHFVLLDEMNLARVEYYFSDVLSVMESRKRDGGKISTSNLLDEKYTGRPLSLPENLYIIGTVNMDETTHPFSKKVLDRANTIEFNEIHLDDFDFLEQQEDVEVQRVHNEQLISKYILLKDVYEKHKTLIAQVSNELTAFNGLLEPMNMHVGYRVRDEMCFYMIHNENAGLLAENEAFDFCLMQKILPRITGSDERIDKLLNDFFEQLTGAPYDANNVPVSSKYPRSANKVAEMLGRYYSDGFTSFWIS